MQITAAHDIRNTRRAKDVWSIFQDDLLGRGLHFQSSTSGTQQTATLR